MNKGIIRSQKLNRRKKRKERQALKFKQWLERAQATTQYVYEAPAITAPLDSGFDSSAFGGAHTTEAQTYGDVYITEAQIVLPTQTTRGFDAAQWGLANGPESD